MLIILSQRIDTDSDYSDEVFETYHYPSRYKNQIHERVFCHANFDILYRQMEKETDEYAYQYSDTPWNLFENLVDN